MDNTPFSNKCEIIEDFYLSFGRNPDYQAYFLEFDIGVPLAVCVMQDYAVPTDAGKFAIEEAWYGLCGWLDVDPLGYYEDLAEMTDE